MKSRVAASLALALGLSCRASARSPEESVPARVAVPRAGSQAACPCCCATVTATDIPTGPDPASPALLGRGVYQLNSEWETDSCGTFRLSQLAGRPAVVALFYTSCHVACPATLRVLKDVERRLPERSDVAIVLVTIDPQTDTPIQLARCRSEWLLSRRFILLRGTDAATRGFADASGIVFRREAARIVHVPKIVVVDRLGSVVASYPGGRAEPRDVARAALAVGAEDPAPARNARLDAASVAFDTAFIAERGGTGRAEVSGLPLPTGGL